jgi:hypothetical protein
MFGELVAEYLEWSAAAVHADFERLELEARALEARRMAARIAAESVQNRRSMVTGRPRPT